MPLVVGITNQALSGEYKGVPVIRPLLKIVNSIHRGLGVAVAEGRGSEGVDGSGVEGSEVG